MLNFFREKKSYVIRKISGSFFQEEKENIYNFYQKDNNTIVAGPVQPTDCTVKQLKRFSGCNYYISPYSYTFSHEAVLESADCPGGVSVEVDLDVKIDALAPDFGNWLMSEGIETLEKDQFLEMLEQEKFGIARYLQKIISNHNIRLLKEHGEEAVSASYLGHNVVLPPWLYVQNIKWKNIDFLPTAAQNAIAEFEKKQEERNRQLEEESNKLALEVNLNNIEEARKEIEHQNKIKEIERQRLIKVEEAKEEAALHEIENEKQLDALQVEKKQLENAILLAEQEIAQNASAKAAQEGQLRIAKLNSELNKLALEEARIKADNESSAKHFEILLEKVEVQAEVEKMNLAKARVEFEMAQESNKNQKEKHAKDIELIDLQIQLAKIQLEKNAAEQAKEAEISQIKQQQAVDIEGLLTAVLGKFAPVIQACENRMQHVEEQKTAVYYNLSPEAVIDFVQTQKELHPVTLKKEDVVAETIKVASRDISLPVKTAKIRVGSRMKFSFCSELAGYVTIICFGSSCRPADGSIGKNNVCVLEPNFCDGNYRIEAGKTYILPGGDLLPGYADLHQDGPAGVERLLIVVSENPLLSVNKELTAFDTLSQDRLQMFFEKLTSLPKDTWAAGYLAYCVEE